MSKLRFIGTKPIGSVNCSKCDENKNSGCIFKVENMGSGGFDKTILCDECARKREKWYKERENEGGLVILDN